jgi:hypothetical protein
MVAFLIATDAASAEQEVISEAATKLSFNNFIIVSLLLT